MKKQIQLLLILSLIILSQNSYAATRADTAIKVNNVKYKLCVGLPAGFKANESYPLVVALHYCGGTATQYVDALAKLSDSLKMIIVSPEDESGAGLSNYSFITTSIDSAKSVYKIKENEVFLTGMSCNGDVTLRAGLSKIYPFKGIVPWVPWITYVDNKTLDLNSNIPTVVSVGTADPNFGTILRLYDSLMFHGNKANLVLAMDIGHILVFSTFAEEMIRSFRYLNDTDAIKINKIDDISMRDDDPVKEIVTEFTYAGTKDLNIISRTSNTGIIPLPKVSIDGNKIKVSVDPTPGKLSGAVWVVVEVAEKNGLAIEQVVFKVNIKSSYNAINKTNSSDFSAYPIPAHNQLYLNSSEQNLSLQINDITGKTIIVKNNFDTSTPLNIEGLKKGAYFLTAYGKSGKQTVKFLIE